MATMAFSFLNKDRHELDGFGQPYLRKLYTAQQQDLMVGCVPPYTHILWQFNIAMENHHLQWEQLL